MLAKDFTYWDDLVHALATEDHDWATANLGDTALATYNANALWILHPDRKPFYSRNNLYATDLTELTLPGEGMERVFGDKKFAHFFMKTPQGLMEIRGATIHPSQDSARSTPPRGYFFAGRLWSNESVREMGLFTNNQIHLADAPEPPAGGNTGTVSFSRELNGADGRPLAYLVVKNESPAVTQLTRYTGSLFVWVVGFSLVVLLIIAVAVVEWVSRPLRLISEALNTGNTAPLRKLQDDSSEFGKLAQLIHHFFEQRVTLLNEMTERRGAEEALERSEEQLRQSQKMEAVGQLAGGVAHDFNNLLTVIIGYTDLLIERCGHDRVSLQSAEMVRKAGEQAAALTRQLLAFSRKQILQPRVIDVNALITEMEKLLRRVIGEHIDVRTILDAQHSRVKADPSQLEQVLINLGVNARDAMPGGGVLTVRTTEVLLNEESSRVQAGLQSGKYVLIAVTDTGDGMDRETQERIFEPFFTTKGPGKGTGLGLATVYGIIKQSGGGIAVESAPGRGASFRIYLPLEDAPLDPPRAHAPPVEPSTKKETILVVEDEEIVRKLICDVLKRHGYNVLCAERGSEALRMAEEHPGPIHLLLTDVVMPEMNGYELARRIEILRPEARIVYVSGYSNVESSTEGEAERLQKPFTPQELAGRVREMLSRSPDLAGVGN
jgi:signal transduction histidine kinase